MPKKGKKTILLFLSNSILYEIILFINDSKILNKLLFMILVYFLFLSEISYIFFLLLRNISLNGQYLLQ